MRTLLISIISIGLVGCGGEAVVPVPPPAAPQDALALDSALASLVPADAAGLIYVPNLAEAIDALRGMVREVRPGSERIIDLSLIEPMLGGLRVTDLEPSKPAAIALRMRENEPMPILIVPVKDVSTAKDLVEIDATTSGGWIALSAGAGPVAAGAAAPPLALGMPSGTISMRIDLDRFDGALADAEHMLMAELRRAGPSGASAVGVYDWLFDVLRNDARYLDMSTHIDGGVLGMAFGLDTGKPGPQIAGGGDLGDVTRRVPADAGSMAFTMNGDLSSFVDSLQPMLDSMTAGATEQQRNDLKRMLGAQRELYAALAGPTAGRFGLGPDGFNGVLVTKPSDIQAAVREIHAFAESSADLYEIDPASVTETTVGETIFRTVVVDTAVMSKFSGVADPQVEEQSRKIVESLYGKSLTIHSGAVDEYLVIVMGKDEGQLATAVAAVKSADADDAEFKADLAKLSATPYMFMSMNLFEIMRPMMDAMPFPPGAPIPDVPADAKAKMWFGMSEHEGRHAMEFAVDVGAISAMFR